MLENFFLGTKPQHLQHVVIEGRTQTITDSKLASLQPAGAASLGHHLEMGSGFPVSPLSPPLLIYRHSVPLCEHFSWLP